MNQSKQTPLWISWVLTAILILLTATLQTTFVRALEVFHVVPNLLFILVISYSLTHEDNSSLVVSVICGVIMDVISGRMIGINALLFVYATYFCLSIRDNLFNNNTFVAMVFVLFLTIPYEFLTYIFHFVIWGKSAWWYAILCKILPGAVYNFIFTLLWYPIVKKMTALNMKMI